MARQSGTDIVGLVVDVTATTTSTLLAAGNTNRNYFFIQNKSAASTIYIKYKSAHTALEGIKLAAGESFEPYAPSRDAIYIVCAAGTATVCWMEGNNV